MDISPTKVAQVAIMAREIDRSEAELRAFIGRMNEDEQAELVAIMWIGRGSFEAADLQEAITTARTEASVPCADYLLGSPHLPDHLENGLDALGVSASDEEDGLM
ncbi:DUF3775 domain-containing protein [Pontibaca salina]|uniref:DUF3775 domain-containing protein n=1 Tax=Pontibaca salina TaxID=2795731 RepID=A0A934HSE5_9RHOB|nr:DUF3775 domain-containing protein [Pontibaca salina]MBI6630932.1 DUF3775 domain-containing protein [Pontibaca salina]